MRGRNHGSAPTVNPGGSSVDSQARRDSQRRGEASSSSKSKGVEKEGVTKSNPFQFANAKPFRLALMKVISDKIVYCTNPLTVIPLLQVLLVIITELDGTSVEERQAIENMVQQLLRVIKLEVSLVISSR